MEEKETNNNEAGPILKEQKLALEPRLEPKSMLKKEENPNNVL